MSENWFKELFIDEAKPALKRHSSSGGSNVNIQPLTVTKNGTYSATGGVHGYSPITVDVLPQLEVPVIQLVEV